VEKVMQYLSRFLLVWLRESDFGRAILESDAIWFFMILLLRGIHNSILIILKTAGQVTGAAQKIICVSTVLMMRTSHEITETSAEFKIWNSMTK